MWCDYQLKMRKQEQSKAVDRTQSLSQVAELAVESISSSPKLVRDVKRALVRRAGTTWARKGSSEGEEAFAKGGFRLLGNPDRRGDGDGSKGRTSKGSTDVPVTPSMFVFFG